MRRYFIFFSCLLMILFLFPIHLNAEKTSIQQLIDEANPGDTIYLSEGFYVENIVIDKPIHLIGEKDLIIQNKSDSPIITIRADHMKLENMTLQYETEEIGLPAVSIESSDNELRKLLIETNSLGIRLDEANRNELSEITIEGKKETPFNQRKHGIDVWKSNNNKIHHNQITNVQDGIYAESSKETNIHDNIVTNSRYGYHLMFTENTTLEKNESYENISGMMIMGTNGTKVHQNNIKYNQKNVQSLGLLLFDVRNATISDNDIAHNRIGIFMEESINNYLTRNNVQSNFIGIQFKRSENNTVINNAFTANVVQGQAEQSYENETNENYWGDHVGLDTTGDGLSDLTYEIDPFYLHLTNEYPPYRLLFQSPGMIFLEQLLHTPVEERLTDGSPLMNNPIISTSTGEESETTVLLFSSMFLTLSIGIIFLGVRKR